MTVAVLALEFALPDAGGAERSTDHFRRFRRGDREQIIDSFADRLRCGPTVQACDAVRPVMDGIIETTDDDRRPVESLGQDARSIAGCLLVRDFLTHVGDLCLEDRRIGGANVYK